MGHKAQDIMVGSGLCISFTVGKNEYVAQIEVDESTGGMKVDLNNAKLIRKDGVLCQAENANIKRRRVPWTALLGMVLLAFAIAVIVGLRI